MATNYFPIEFSNAGDSFIITNNGTAPAPCVITIVPRVDFMRLTIEGLTDLPITVANVMTGDILVIDGEQRKITINDNDAFSRYNAWEFPKLQPGTNTITIANGAQLSVSIEYNPRYI